MILPPLVLADDITVLHKSFMFYIRTLMLLLRARHILSV